MPTPNENLIKLHQNLSQKWEGFNVPFDQFQKDMQDETNLQRLHKNLSDKWQGFAVPYEKFKADMGFGVTPEASTGITEVTPAQMSSVTDQQPMPQLGGGYGSDRQKLSSFNPDGTPKDAPHTNFLKGVKAGWQQLKSGLTETAANLAPAIGLANPLSVAQSVDYYTGNKDNELGQKVAGMKKSADEMRAAAPEGDGFAYSLGTFIPQAIGIVAATASAPFTSGTSLSVVPSVIGTANLATLVGSAMGESMNTYEDYMVQKGEEPNEAAMWGVGILAGGAEYFAEKLGSLNRYIPKGAIPKVVTKMFASGDQRAAANLFAQFTRSDAFLNLVKKYGWNAIKHAGEEGFEEVATELGYIAIEYGYKDFADAPGAEEIKDRLLQSFEGGAMMGGMISPVSTWSKSAMVKKARQQNGFVTLVKGNDGNAYEALYYDQDKGVYQVVDPSGKEMVLPEASVESVSRFGLNDFENFRKMAAQGKDVSDELQYNAEVNLELDNIEQNIQARMYRGEDKFPSIVNGQQDDDPDAIVTVSTPDGNKYQIVSGSVNTSDPSNPMVGVNLQSGERVFLSPERVSSIDIVPAEQMRSELTLEAQNRIKGKYESIRQAEKIKEQFAPGDQITFNGTEAEIVDVTDPTQGVTIKVVDGKGEEQVIQVPPAMVGSIQPVGSGNAPAGVTGTSAAQGKSLKLDGKSIPVEDKGNGTYNIGKPYNSQKTAVSTAKKLADIYPKLSFEVIDNTPDDDFAEASFAIVATSKRQQANAATQENNQPETAIPAAAVESDGKVSQEETGVQQQDVEQTDQAGNQEVTNPEVTTPAAEQQPPAGEQPTADVGGEIYPSVSLEQQQPTNEQDIQGQPENEAVQQDQTQTPEAVTAETAEEGGRGIETPVAETQISANEPANEAANEQELMSQNATSETQQTPIANESETQTQTEAQTGQTEVLADAGETKQDSPATSTSRYKPIKMRGKEWNFTGNVNDSNGDLEFADPDGNTMWVAKTAAKRVVQSAGKYLDNILAKNDIKEAEAQVDTNPSEAQKEAGNYAKGHIKLNGFDITIENPKGSTRSGVDKDGKPWSVEMKNTYGYFKRTNGKDGDQIDVFIGDNPLSEKVFVVDQINPDTGKFDESKVMMGFNSADEAQKAYMSNYSPGWKGFGNITEVSTEDFKKWLYDGAKQGKAFSEYKDTPLPINTNTTALPVPDSPVVDDQVSGVNGVKANPIGIDNQIEDILLGKPENQDKSVEEKAKYAVDNVDRIIKINGTKVYDVTVEYNNGVLQRWELKYNLKKTGNSNNQKYYYPVQYAEIEYSFPDRTSEAKQVQDVAGQESGQRPAVKEAWEMTREEWNKGEWRDLTEEEVSQLKGIRESNSTLVEWADLNGVTAYRAQDSDRNPLGNWEIKIKDQEKLLTRDQHKSIIQQALSEGKPVPAEVLVDYPELIPPKSVELKPLTAGKKLEQMLAEGNKPKHKKQLSKEQKQVSTMDFFTPEQLAMQWFASGGILNTGSLFSLFGTKGKENDPAVRRKVESERKPRFAWVSGKGKTIDQIAHELWQDNIQLNIDSDVFRNAVEEVVLRYNSPQQMAKDLLKEPEDDSRLPSDYIPGESYEDYERRIEDEAFEIYVNNIGEMPPQSEIDLLFLPQDTTENEGQENEPAGVQPVVQRDGTETGSEGRGVGLQGENETPQPAQGEVRDGQVNTRRQQEVNAEIDDNIKSLKSKISDIKKSKNNKLAEIQKRQGLFGDAKPIGGMFSGTNEETEFTEADVKAALAPFDRDIAELERQIDNLEKGRANAIGVAGRQVSIDGFQPETSTKIFKYRLLYRPANQGIPANGFTGYEEDGTKYGLLVYNRELTPDEIRSYELEPVVDINEYIGKDVVYYEDGEQKFYATVSSVGYRNKVWIQLDKKDENGEVIEHEQILPYEFLEKIKTGELYVDKSVQPETPPRSAGEKLNQILSESESAISQAAAKFGWTTQQNNGKTELINRNGKVAAILTEKSGKYTISDMSGNKLLSGNKNAADAVETVIRDYFFGKDSGVRFKIGESTTESLSNISERNNVALHNLSGSSILKIDELGGMVMPSIAITRRDIPFNDFGDITLIATSDLIDPRNGANVYTRDSWTPTVPSPEYKVTNKLWDFVKQADPYFIKFNEYFSDVDYKAKRGKESFMSEMAGSTAMMDMFLETKGKGVEPIYSKKKVRNSGVDNPELIKFVLENKQELQQSRPGDPIYKQFSDLYRKAYIESLGGLDKEDIEYLDKLLLKNTISEDGNLYFSKADSIISEILDREKSLDELDKYDTNKSAKKAIEDGGYEDEFIEWLDEKITPVFSDPFIVVRGKKVPYTVDNIYDYMSSQKEKAGQKTMTFGLAKAVSAASRKLNSVDEIREFAKGLVSKETESEFFDKEVSELSDKYRSEITGYYRYNDTWDALNDAHKAIYDYLKGGISKRSYQRMKSSLGKNGFKDLDYDIIELALDLAHNAANAPTDYIEAKIPDVVSLKSFKYAVIPSDTKQKVRDVLTKKGITIVEYDDTDRQNRIDAVRRTVESDPDVRFRTVSPTGFYSTVENALESIKQDKGTPEQFKAMLLKNGAKQAEMDWMGWDDTFAGKKSITKADVQQWIDENRIEVQEVVKDGVKRTLTRAEALKELDKGNIVYNEYGGEITTLKDLDYYNVYYTRDGLNPTKYSQYQLPGGENYREVLLVMPVKVNTVSKITELPSDYEFIKDGDKWGVIPVDQIHARPFSGLHETKEEARQSAIDKINRLSKQGAEDKAYNSQFKSGHFDEPNILAHVRFNERTVDVNNKNERVLMVEEFQSDLSEKIRQLEILINSGKAKESDIKELERLKNITPFPKTDQWVNLALRKMMRYAAENGFDRIAWTNGEMQAERYDLSKQVDEITISPSSESKISRNPDYFKDIVIDMLDSKTRLSINKDGKVIEGGDAYFGKGIDELVGKDIAEKILNSEGETSLSGLDLKVGGSGMKAFYDAIIPSAASKLGKPFGAKLEVISIDTDPTITDEGIDIESGDIVTPPSGKYQQVQSLPVTDSMRESVLQGVPLFKSDQGYIDRYATRADQIRQYSDRAKELGKQFGVPIRVITNRNQLPERISRLMSDKRIYPGVFDGRTGNIYVLVNEVNDMGEVEKTIAHEIVAHKGLRDLLGAQNFNELLYEVYDSMTPADIIAIKELYNTESRKLVADEYIASLAESGNFPSWFGRVMARMRNLLRDAGFNVRFNDADIMYLLWESRRRLLKNSGVAGYVDYKAAESDVKESVRFSIIGETGAANLDKAEEATTRMDNLAVAREMEAANKDAKTIRLATGWERGADGKWRYEVSDYIQAVSDVFELENKYNGTVIKNANVFLSKEVNSAYPGLKDVVVRIDIKDNAKNEGSFGHVTINGKKVSSEAKIEATDIAKAQSILSHEIQHAIQDIEGFAKGGNPESSKLKSGMIEERDLTQTGLDNLRSAIQYGDEKAEIYSPISGTWKTINKESFNSWLLKLQSELNNIQGYLLNNGFLLDGYERYRRLSGEVEARNVQTRMNYTPEQRRETLLAETEDVAREDQIFLQESLGAQNSTKNVVYLPYEETSKISEGKVEYKRNGNTNTGVQESFQEWEKRMLQEYAEKLRRLTSKKFNEKQYISHEEASDIAFLLFELKRANYQYVSQSTIDMATVISNNYGFIELSNYAKSDLKSKGFNVSEGIVEYLPATLTIDGVERPTTNSKGQPIALTEEGVRNFWKWFGNSKVVDEQGKPLVVYHGSQEDQFNTFNSGLMFFSQNEYVAQSYGSESFYNTYLKIENPLDLKGKNNIGNIAFTDKELVANVKSAINELPDNYKVELSYGEINKQEILNNIVKSFNSIEYLDHNYLPLAWDAIYKYAMKKGHDGWMHLDESSDRLVQFAPSFAVFSPTQIKSATGNDGSFSPDNPDIRFRIAPNVNLEPKMITRKRDKQRELWQDKMLAGKKLLEEVKRRGGIVNLITDFYNTENRMQSRSMAMITDFEKDQMDKLNDTLAEIISKHGQTLDSINDYLLAKSSLHRNDMEGVKAIDDDDNAAWGRNAVEKIIADFEAAVPTAVYNKLWADIKKTTDFAIRTLYLGNVISKKAFDAMRVRQFYVPLKSWNFAESDNPIDYYEYIDSQRDAFQGLIKARGRGSKADDPLAYIQSAAHSAVVSANRNMMKHKVLNLARLNKGMTDLFNIKHIYIMDKGVDQNGDSIYLDVIKDGDEAFSINGFDNAGNPILVNEGLFEDLYDNGIIKSRINENHTYRRPKYIARQHEVEVFENGEKYIIAFGDPNVANAINNKNAFAPEVTRAFQNTIGKVNRWLTSNFTAKNPAFIPINWIRDFGYAITAQAIKSDGNLSLFLKNYPDAVKAIHKYLAGTSNPAAGVDMLFAKFREFGGETGYVHLKEIESLKRDIQREIDRKQGIRKGWDKLTQNKALKLSGKALDYMAIMSENSARFATFLASVEAGKSYEEAASDAKNITVNFNRKGRISGLAGSVYGFFNATTQGGANIISMAKNNKTRFAVGAAGFIAAGILLAELLRALYPDEYEKIPKWVRDTCIVVPVPGDDGWLTIPLPQGFRSLWALGVNGSEMIHGNSSVFEGLFDSVNGIFDAFSPISMNFNKIQDSENVSEALRPLIPTSLIPIYDIIQNEDFTGKPIYRVPFTSEMEKYTPETELGMKNVNTVIKWITDRANRLGGGDANRPPQYSIDDKGNVRRNGWGNLLDWNPSIIEHTLEYYLGGRGRFFNEVFKTAKAAVKIDEDVKSYNIPVVKRLYMTPYDGKVWKDYMDIRTEVQNYNYFLNNAEKTGNYELLETMYGNEKMQIIAGMFEGYDKTVQNYSDLIKVLENPEEIKVAKDERDAIIKEFITEVQKLNKDYKNQQ